MSQQIVVLIVTIPMLLSAVVSLNLSMVLDRSNKKYLLLAGLACIFAGGLAIVLSGGRWFAVTLLGAMLDAVGYAVVMSVSSAVLVELYPEDSGRVLGVNGAAGCVGSIIMFFLSGKLAASGVWVRVFFMNFAVILPILAILLFFHQPEAAQKLTSKTQRTEQNAPVSREQAFRAVAVLVPFILFNLACSSWNLNVSSYIILEKQIGTAAQSSSTSIMASLGGVISGFFMVAPITKLLKHYTAPICILSVAASYFTIILGTESVYALYATGFFFMLMYEPIRTQLIVAASKAVSPGIVIPVATAINGLAGFVAPYVINRLAEIGGGAIAARVSVGVVFDCTKEFFLCENGFCGMREAMLKEVKPVSNIADPKIMKQNKQKEGTMNFFKRSDRPEDKLCIAERVWFSCSNIPVGINYILVAAYLMFYLTDYVGLNAAVIGTIILVCRVLDGITDLTMGAIIDRTHTRWGKARPWVLIGTPLLAVILFLMFAVPLNCGGNPVFCYAQSRKLGRIGILLTGGKMKAHRAEI